MPPVVGAVYVSITNFVTNCSIAYSHACMFIIIIIIIIASKRISLELYIVELCNFVYLGHSVESWSTQTQSHQNLMIVIRMKLCMQSLIEPAYFNRQGSFSV